MKRYASIVGLMLCALLAGTAQAEEAAAAVDNGTDPTKFSRVAEAKYEYFDLNDGFSSGTLRLSYTEPLGANKDYSLRLRVPVTRVDILGNDRHELGDVSLQVAHVFGLTREQGFVAQGELFFDTAQRQELGAGKNAFKATLIYARFLSDGAIFAPAIVQNNSFSGDQTRAKINVTTFDFYYVPKFADPRNLLTLDPALSFDWESNKQFASLAATMGRVIGPVFGGNGIVFVKPTVFAGGDRPGKWGIELGYKVIGF